MKTEIKPYILKSDGGKISAALAKLCTFGALGEPLVRNGVSQGAFVLFIAKVAKQHFDAGRSVEQVADVLSLISGGNASAAKQALNDCTIEIEGEKPQSVGQYWGKAGGTKSAPNLSILDI